MIQNVYYTPAYEDIVYKMMESYQRRTALSKDCSVQRTLQIAEKSANPEVIDYDCNGSLPRMSSQCPISVHSHLFTDTGLLSDQTSPFK